MTFKQGLIQRVSCWLATLYISILTGWNVGKTLYKHACGVGNILHVAQGFKANPICLHLDKFCEHYNGASRLHLWLEGLLLILTLNASTPAMHACGVLNPCKAR